MTKHNAGALGEFRRERRRQPVQHMRGFSSKASQHAFVGDRGGRYAHRMHVGQQAGQRETQRQTGGGAHGAGGDIDAAGSGQLARGDLLGEFQSRVDESDGAEPRRASHRDDGGATIPEMPAERFHSLGI